MAEKKAPARSRKTPAAASDATDVSLIPDAPVSPDDTPKPADMDDAVIVSEEPRPGDPVSDPEPAKSSDPVATDDATNDAKNEATDTRVDPDADRAAATGEPDATDKATSENPPPAEKRTPASPAPGREKVVERVIEHRGSAIPMVLAGLVVAAAGFAAGQIGLLPVNSPAPPPDLSADVAALTDRLSGVETGLTDLAARPVAEAAAPDLAPVDARLGAIETALSDLTAQRAEIEETLAALDTRITELAARPITEGASEEAVAAFEAELAGLQSAIAAQRAEVEQMVAAAQATEADAAEQARRAEAQAAIGRLVAALDRGDELQAELAALSALDVTIPEALTGASEGVATLSALQAGFPDAARAALAAARTADSGDSGVAGWLQKQLGARSVTPRAGDDPDAVLSRAEAALTQGRIDEALQELQALPPAAQATLADWRAAATARRDALQAVDALAAELTSN